MEKRKTKYIMRIISIVMIFVFMVGAAGFNVLAESTLAESEKIQTEQVLEETLSPEEDIDLIDQELLKAENPEQEDTAAGAVTVGIFHGEDTILTDVETPIYQGDSMMDAIERACQSNNLIIEFSDDSKSYITSIGGISEFDEGPASGWMGTLNNWFTDYGFNYYKISNGTLCDGDEIRVLYTTNYGMDLTNTMDGTGNLTALSVEGGRLHKTFTGTDYEYTLLPEGAEETKIFAEAINRQYKVSISVNEVLYRNNESIPIQEGIQIFITTQAGSGMTAGAGASSGQTYVLTVSDTEPEPEPTVTPTPTPSHAHSWSSWKTTKRATALAAGVKQRSCSGCQKTEKAAIAKLKATIKVNASSLRLQVGKSTTRFKVSGLAYGDSVKSYRSGNTKLFTVNTSGKITAKKKTGKSTLTITLASGLKKSIPVTIQAGMVKTSKITGISTSLTLARGKTTTLKPVRSPITSQQSVTYATSNKSVATVDKSGKVKGIKKGRAVITVKSGSITKKCTVTVK